MSGMPRQMRHKQRMQKARGSMRPPAPHQILPLPVDRRLTNKGQPEIKDGRIAPPSLPPSPQILPIGSGKPLF